MDLVLLLAIFSFLSVRVHPPHSNLEFTLPKSVEKQSVNCGRCSWLWVAGLEYSLSKW